MFTDWSIGADSIAAAMESLGMSITDLLYLVVSFAGMAVICQLTLDKARQEPLPALHERAAAVDMSAYAMAAFGVLIIALCWVALLTNADVSGFAYFQF